MFNLLSNQNIFFIKYILVGNSVFKELIFRYFIHNYYVFEEDGWTNEYSNTKLVITTKKKKKTRFLPIN